MTREDDLDRQLDDETRLRQFLTSLRERLDRRELQAAVLCYIYDYSRPEAARLVGVPPKRMEKIMDGVSRKLAPVLSEIRSGTWCEQHRSLVKAYALGLLEEDGERYAIARDHVDDCASCRRSVLRTRGIAAVAPPVPLLLGGAALVGAGASHAGGEQAGGAAQGAARGRGRSQGAKLAAAAAAAAAVLVALVLALGGGSERDGPPETTVPSAAARERAAAAASRARAARVARVQAAAVQARAQARQRRRAAAVRRRAAQRRAAAAAAARATPAPSSTATPPPVAAQPDPPPASPPPAQTPAPPPTAAPPASEQPLVRDGAEEFELH